MKISLRWLNSLLSTPVDASQAERILMSVGFPIDSISNNLNDSLLDVEVTSNRGDCLSHLGLAREIVASQSHLHLVDPLHAWNSTNSPPSTWSLQVDTSACPRFLACLISNVSVAPSPPWLASALEAIGQRSINNIVDVTNYIAATLGNPCHAFDADRLTGDTLHVRFAHDGETLTTLDNKKRTLKSDEVVVADVNRPHSLAGVMGGHDSEVSSSTRNVLFEMATWDPVAVRRASRRHQLRTDASHRFERVVDPRTLDEALLKAIALLVQLAGGTPHTPLAQGLPLAPPTRIRLRTSRVGELLGSPIPTDEIHSILSRLAMHFEPIGRSASEFAVVPPVYRPDLSREVDLIEEVARIRGMDAISVSPKMNLRVRSPQASEAARREISGLLTGQGFFETVTFSFCTRDQSAMFIPDGLQQVEVDDERRGHEPALRPSVLAGLLGCRLLNANARVVPSGGVRLFEYSSTFAQSATASRVENLALGLLMDCPVSARTPSTSDLQMGVRHLRGILHLIARSVLGTTCELTLEAAPPHCPAFRPGAFASLKADGEPLGFFGILSEAAHAAYGLEIPVVGAELSMDVLTRSFPPRTKLEALPEFPSIERDISFIVDETVSYAALEAGVRASNVTWLQGCSFVGTYRGKQIGAGRKSVTLRLQFRDASRTLRHDEVDQPAEAVVNSLKAQVGATVREG